MPNQPSGSVEFRAKEPRIAGLSKAFLRESDDEPDPPDIPRQAAILPPGARNNLTADGAPQGRCIV